jgi:ribonuclease HII
MSKKSGKKEVIGVDEVGRGPLAGPITVCAFYCKDENLLEKEFFVNGIRDSKKISKVLRNNIVKTIRKRRKLVSDVAYAISSRSALYIDRHGISKATTSCVDACIEKLAKQGIAVTQVPILLDAGLKCSDGLVKQKSFVKGDEHFTSIALASIIAKEARDSYMIRLAKEYVIYSWGDNVGYGTRAHCDAIKKNGITKYHRRSFLKNFKLFIKS